VGRPPLDYTPVIFQIGDLRLIYRYLDDSPTRPMVVPEETTQSIELEAPAFRIDLKAPDQGVPPGAHISAELTITNTDAEAIAIVAHAGVNRLLLCRLLGMPVQNMFRLGQDYGCVNVVEVERRNIRVRLINGRCANLDD